jgi:hypothetical protein
MSDYQAFTNFLDSLADNLQNFITTFLGDMGKSCALYSD